MEINKFDKDGLFLNDIGLWFINILKIKINLKGSLDMFKC